MAQPDTRTIDIQIQGYLKSIIESGAAQTQWEKKLKAAFNIHMKLRKEILAKHGRRNNS